MSQGFTFIDLFAGIGGLRQAMESIGGRCVFTSEWDKFARLTYEANYLDNRKAGGDITEISADEIPAQCSLRRISMSAV
jgi:DNA (cytosine-5)-methyltransferase 1